MVRTAGTPAITYGADVLGMSSSHLNRARAMVARAAAPEGGGKDHNVVLRAIDGNSGTTDPAFDAHTKPIGTWAFAWWQNWQPRSLLQRAFDNAVAKTSSAKRSPWDVATGPTTGLVATMRRIGWEFTSAHLFADDQGNLHDLTLDPPCVVVGAVKASVRRWTLAKIFTKHPNALPRSLTTSWLALNLRHLLI